MSRIEEKQPEEPELKINIALQDAQGRTVHSGQVDTDDILDAHLVSYQGKTYGFVVTSMIMTSVFRECGDPVVLDDLIQLRDEGI